MSGFKGTVPINNIIDSFIELTLLSGERSSFLLGASFIPPEGSGIGILFASCQESKNIRS